MREAGVWLGRGDRGGRGTGRGRPVEGNVLRNFPLSSSFLAIEWNCTNIPEGILQFRISQMKPPGLPFFQDPVLHSCLWPSHCVGWLMDTNFFLYKFIFFNLFIFGCFGSSLLCTGFL